MCPKFWGDCAHNLRLAIGVARQRKRNGKADPTADEAVHQAVLRAIMEGKLKAGTKLAEIPLAGIFAVSRERIRKVLHRLGAERRRDDATPVSDDLSDVFEPIKKAKPRVRAARVPAMR